MRRDGLVHLLTLLAALALVGEATGKEQIFLHAEIELINSNEHAEFTKEQRKALSDYREETKIRILAIFCKLDLNHRFYDNFKDREMRQRRAIPLSWGELNEEVNEVGESVHAAWDAWSERKRAAECKKLIQKLDKKFP